MLKRGESSVVVNLRAGCSQLMSPKSFWNSLKVFKASLWIFLLLGGQGKKMETVVPFLSWQAPGRESV
jgi:hypothetical protein